MAWAVFYGSIICVGGDLVISVSAALLSLKLKALNKLYS